MVFNRTSCAKHSGRRGFTLVEYLVASSIGLLALGAALVLWVFATRTCASLLDRMDLSNASKIALDRASQQIRNAKSIKSCSATELVMRDATNGEITLTYDAGAKELIMRRGTTRTKLLTQCTNFQFSIFQRTPLPASFNLSTNAWNTNTAKVVQMAWTCSRKLTGDKSSAESQVSARVVIRNQK
jgi:prepilin-type N-terminal cleavage/methylation domain-containing protein